MKRPKSGTRRCRRVWEAEEKENEKEDISMWELFASTDNNRGKSRKKDNQAMGMFSVPKIL